MPVFAIPTLSALAQRARAAWRAYLPGTDAYLWPNNTYVAAKVMAAGNEEIFGRLAYVAEQARPLTATDWLPSWLAQYGLSLKPATPATGTVVVTAPDAMLVPAGTLFPRSDGVAYAASSDQSITAAGSFNVPVVAVTPGTGGLAESGTPLTIEAPLDGVTPSGPGAALAVAVVGPSGITGGLGVEGIEAARARLLFRLRNPPHGGAPSDYVIWCESVPGVTRVFVERLWNGPGTLRVFPIFDDLFAAQGGIADVAAIETVIEALTPSIPGGADVSVMAPNPASIDVVISGLAPLTTVVETSILAELVDTFRRLGAVSGSDTPFDAMPYLATPQTFSRSWISQAIANATGEMRHVLVQPSGDVVIPAGSIPVLGRVSFV